MIEPAYVTNLREDLSLIHQHNNPSRSNDISDVIINPGFSKWKALVSQRLLSIGLLDNEYLQDPDSNLFREAQEHAASYNRPIPAKNIIALTHPFYLHLSDRELFDSPAKKFKAFEAQNYLNRLLGLLEMRLPKEKVGIVVFECIYHYAALTSSLLESGLVDRVVFTGAHTGDVKTCFEPDSTFADKQVFVGGGYNFNSRFEEGCLVGTNKYLYSRVKSPKHLWAITDLVLNHPISYDWFIMPDNILIGSIYKKFPNSRVICLKDALKKIGCEGYSRQN